MNGKCGRVSRQQSGEETWLDSHCLHDRRSCAPLISVSNVNSGVSTYAAGELIYTGIKHRARK